MSAISFLSTGEVTLATRDEASFILVSVNYVLQIVTPIPTTRPHLSSLCRVRSLSVFGKNLQMGGSRSLTADPDTLPDGRMVEAPDDWGENVLTRSRHLVDGSLSLDGFRSGWMAAMTAFGPRAVLKTRNLGRRHPNVASVIVSSRLRLDKR